MTKCENCNTYDAVPTFDKGEPSFRAEIAPQSDADQCIRFIYTYPSKEGTLCYYCQKKADKRIAPLNAYGNSYS